MRFYERYEGWLHAIGWAVFISLPLLTLPEFLFNRQDLLSLGMSQLLTGGLMILFFYYNLRQLTPSVLHQHNTRRFLLLATGMLVCVVVVKVVCFYVFPPSLMPGSNPPPHWPDGLPPPKPMGSGPGTHSPWPGVLGTVLSLGAVLLISSMMALFRHHTRSQALQQQIMLEKVSTELAMLKLQVSPHFLFNTLNNIRWLARQKSDQTEAAVVTLAQLLRYMLYQAQQDSVPLRNEVQHLEDYIDLQKMRLTPIHTVTFHPTGAIDAHQIEPLLFIPFVENAFKYGIHGQQPGHIHIALDVADNTLTFVTDNPALPSPVAELPPSEPGSGIGIANVRKRLALHYAHRHLLTLTNENGRFRVALTLQLHHDTHALPSH
jgi:hypothetical protein